MRILILGGSGFIGKNLIKGLLDQGYDVRILVKRKITEKEFGFSLNLVEIIEGSFFDTASIKVAMSNVDVVIHLLSTTTPNISNIDPIMDVQSNVVGTINILTLAKDAGVKKIIFTSSGGAVYGDALQLPISETHSTYPICSYGITKLAIENYLEVFYRLYDLDYTVLRIANGYGPYQNPESGLGAITTFLWNVLNSKKINIWGNGEIIRDYIYVSDIVSSIISAIKTSTTHKIFNIGNGIPYTLNFLVKKIEQVTNKIPIVEYSLGRKVDVSNNYLDITRAKKELEWKPLVSLEEGILKTQVYLNEIKATS